MPDYFDIPSQRDAAKARFSIPDWFTSYRVSEEWGPFDISTYINTSFTEVIVEKRYAHRDNRCFRIDEYCVYDWRVTVWTGTLFYRLHIDQAKLRAAIREAQLLLFRISRDAIVDYIDPSLGTGGNLVDLGLSFTSLPIPQIFGDLAGAVELGQLLSNINDIANKTERVLRELERLRRLDGAIVARIDNVRFEKQWDRIKTFSSVDIVEVVCADWISEIPEGETIRVPSHGEWLYPTPDDRSLGRTNADRESRATGDDGPEELPRLAKSKLRELYSTSPISGIEPPVPDEIKRDR